MKDTGILMIGPSFDGQGGISAVTKMQYDYLVSKKYRICFLASTVEGNPVLKFFYTCLSYIKFMAIMVSGKISLIHVHCSIKRSFYRKLFYIFLARKLGKKVILQIHPERFLQFYKRSNRFLRSYIKKLFQELDAIIVLSTSIKKSFLEMSPESNILVLNNPVCSSLFKSKKAEDKKEKIILYMGWLVPEKGVYDIAQVIPDVLGSYPSAKFVFCGKNKNDGLPLLFKDSPFKDNIIIKDWVIGEEKTRLFCQSYMLVLPSYSEGFPNVILEAMSSSLPIIATPVGSVPEVIKDQVNGLLISPGDKKALTEKIVLLLENPELCEEMGKANRALARQKYDLEIVGQDLTQIYSKILHKPSTSLRLPYLTVQEEDELLTTVISVKDSLERLYRYCRDQDWMGYDPYDALNSKLFQSVPLVKNQTIFRLFFLQLNKRCRVNLRPVLLIPKGRNPKGVGLFLSALINLYKWQKNKEYLDIIEKFVQWLEQDVSPGYSGDCWGHNFDWQSRAFFLPKGTPTVVNTSFIGRALLGAYHVFQKEKYLQMARSACDFILKDLNRLEDQQTLCFSYSPRDRYFVHNATALGSSFLALTYQFTHEENLARVAKKSIQYVIDHQRPEGFWPYGEDPVAQKTGIDNFHSGFILESLKIYSQSTGDSSYHQNIKRGLKFYQENFFLKDGTPKYYPHKTYPINIHSACQAVITLSELKEYGADQGLLEKIVSWMIQHLQDRRGWFHYQKTQYGKNRIPYMRWAQSWALYALSLCLSPHES